jgi:hypothetical protein
MTGFSIKAGWGNDRKIIEHYPGSMDPFDYQHYSAWLEDAYRRCDEHNAALEQEKGAT